MTTWQPNSKKNGGLFISLSVQTTLLSFTVSTSNTPISSSSALPPEDFHAIVYAWQSTYRKLTFRIFLCNIKVTKFSLYDKKYT